MPVKLPFFCIKGEILDPIILDSIYVSSREIRLGKPTIMEKAVIPRAIERLGNI